MAEVEKICDRVGIMCKGKLVALDSPLALRSEHTERKADVILADNTRETIDLDADEDRAKLAGFVSAGTVASLRTREFDFHATFLKLTGQKYE
jgi:ABC-2 type transport system ATP-binding protein